MQSGLGKWAVIDLETSGIDPVQDQVIDVGFLQFEGTKLVREYRSLVYYEYELSQFIQKLTGITNNQLKKAPDWSKVAPEIQTLEGHRLLAHNASFEESFLKKLFEDLGNDREMESFEDSLVFLGLLYLKRTNLNLESFICDFQLRDKEVHRGLEDSVDLLKVILVAVYVYKAQHHLQEIFFKDLIKKYQLQDTLWCAKFLDLTTDELIEIAQQIKFPLLEVIEKLSAKDCSKMGQERAGMDLAETVSFEFTGQNIEKILHDEEKIKRLIPSYSYRKSQEDLSKRVGQSFKNNVHALIQAPTGVGKTLGYLIPSTLFAIEGRSQVLIATGTKTLQQQAYIKDVPQLMKILGLTDQQLRVTKLVGSGNHLCELLFRQKNTEEDLFTSSENVGARLATVYLELVFFYNSQFDSYHERLTREDLAYSLKRILPGLGEIETAVAVDFRSCIGGRCPFKDQCTYLSGLRHAKESHLILGNHALMLTWPRGLPRPGKIIVDEAHRLEKEATSAYSKTVSYESMLGLVKQLLHLQGVGALFYLIGQTGEDDLHNSEVIQKIKNEVLSNAPMLQDHLEQVAEKSEIYFKRAPRFTSLYWNEGPMPSKQRSKDTLEVALFNHLESMNFILAHLYTLFIPYLAMWNKEDLQTEQELMAYSRFESFVAIIEDLHTALGVCLTQSEDFARSFKFHVDYGFVCEAAPINVGKMIYQELLVPSESVIFTSATLAQVQGEGTRGMEWSTGHIYVPPERRFKQALFLPPAYDYEKNSKIFLCDDTPALYSPDFVKVVLGQLIPLIKDLGGRSLILFSAKNRFEDAREFLLKELGQGMAVFIQGMGNNVVEEYKAHPHGVLLGMESFGEGIDIPGDSLQFVFIDKIPDLRQDLVTNLRREYFEREFGNEFNDYYLMNRTRALHQKLGRLLRTVHDRGGAIIVDSRIKSWKSKTMESFLKLMRPYRVERTVLNEATQGVLNFIKNKDG